MTWEEVQPSRSVFARASRGAASTRREVSCILQVVVGISCYEARLWNNEERDRCINERQFRKMKKDRRTEEGRTGEVKIRDPDRPALYCLYSTLK